MEDDVHSKLDALRGRFVERCRDDALGLAGTNEVDDQMAIAHRISGSAGMFGYQALSDAAQALEEALRRGSNGEDERQRLKEALDALQER